MYYGQPYGAFGDPQTHLSDYKLDVSTSSVRLQLLAAPNLGDAYYQVYIDTKYAGSIFAPEGLYSDWASFISPPGSKHDIRIFRTGASDVASLEEFTKIGAESPTSVVCSFVFDYEVIGTQEDIELSNWTLTDLSIDQTQEAGMKTRGGIPLALEVSGGTAVVNLGAVAQGSGPVGTTVTLSEVAGSGVSGSVDVGAGAVSADSTLVIRWPRNMTILRNETDPPTTEIASIPFTREDTGEYTDKGLALGTYYYAYQAISDTDDIGDKSTSTEITVTGAPEPPTDLAYDSGDSAATVISFAGSTTAGATYNGYRKLPSEDYLDIETPVATAIAGSTSMTFPLFTDFPGEVQYVIRAELAGVEEKNTNILRVSYDNTGTYVDERPNTPEISSIIVDDGLLIDCTAVYSTADEAGVAATVNLYTRTQTGSYNFAVPDDSATLGTEFNGIKNAKLSKTFATPGWYYVTSKAETASGQLNSGNAPEVSVYVSDTNISAPSGSFVLQW